MSPCSPRCFTFRLLIYIALGFVLLSGGSTLPAQTTIRRLTGIVTDRRHEPLAGAVVQLHDDNTDSVISYITNRSGRYVFQRISADDDYHVQAAFRGHQSRAKFLSKFSSKPDRSITLVIKLQ